MSEQNNVISLNWLKNLQYSIFYGPSFSVESSPLRESIFSEWSKFWNSHFEETQSPKVYSEELLRSTYVTAVHLNNQVAAIHLYSIWDIENKVHLHSRYLNQYPQEAIEKMRSLGLKKVLSLEYFYLLPDWRFKKTKLPLSEAVIGLGMNIFKQNPTLNGIISIARKVVKSDDRVASWGMWPIHDMKMHNNDCSVVVCRRSDYKDCADPNTLFLTQYLWKKREMCGFEDTISSITPLKKAS